MPEVPMEREQEPREAQSRRDFLKRAPVALVGGLILGVALSKPLLSRFGLRRRAPEFPKGSIFTPAKETHKRQ
jgi:hypothetical protein